MNCIVGFIPARSGSKEIKNKNLMKIGGKSLIEIAVYNALKSRYLDFIVFTSDSDKYIKLIKKKFKSKKLICINRPKKYSTDKASNFETIKHSCDQLTKMQIDPNIVVILQPTTPFRNQNHIDNAIRFFFKKKENTIITVTRTSYPPYWMLTKNRSNEIKLLIKNGNRFKRRQDCRETFKPSGMIYILKYKNLEKLLKSSKLIPIDLTYGLEFDRLVSINIDNNVDLEFAKFIKKKFF